MVKYLVVVCLFAAGCNNRPGSVSVVTSANDSISANSKKHLQTENTDTAKLIVPGDRVDKILLHSYAANLEVLPGKPGASDAAMGKAWSTWYGDRKGNATAATELDIYTAYADASMRTHTVQQVRLNSSFFATAEGIHIGSTLDEIKTAFPQIVKPRFCI